MSRQDDRFRRAIRLVSEAAQGRKIKTFCGAVIGNSQKVFFIWRASRLRGEERYDWEPIEDFASARRAHSASSFHRTGDWRARRVDDGHSVCWRDELRQLLVV